MFKANTKNTRKRHGRPVRVTSIVTNEVALFRFPRNIFL